MDSGSLKATDQIKTAGKAAEIPGASLAGSAVNGMSLTARSSSCKELPAMSGKTAIPGPLPFWKKHHYKRGTHCAYCQCLFTHSNHITKDHITPRSGGGADRTRNYIAACKSCNNDKAGLPLRLWIEHLIASGDPRHKNAWKVYNKTAKDRASGALQKKGAQKRRQL